MNRESKIGIFVLIGLAAMFYVVLRTGEVKRLLGQEPETKEAFVVLTDASGLRSDTSVEIAGVKVGKVERIELEGEVAVAVVSLPKDFALKDGARATVKSKGVLGERYIALHPGTGEPLAEPVRLNAHAPPDLGEITTTLQQIGTNLVEITDALKASTMTDQGTNRMQAIAENIEKLSGVLVDMIEENRGNMQTTSSEIASLTKSLNRDVPALITELTELTKGFRSMAEGNRSKFDQTFDNITKLSGNIEAASVSLNSIVAKVDQGQGSLGKLVNDSATTDKLNTLLDSANESVSQIKNFVNKANDIQLDLMLSSDYHAEQGGTKTRFGLKIRPNDDKYYLVEGITISEELEIIEVNERRELVFDADGNLVSELVFRSEEDPDDFLINGLLAYRVGPIFLRGGLIESEPGGGIEYNAYKNRLKFTFDAFDFSRGNDLNPHAKLDFRYDVGKGIHFNVGWDDFLESGRESAIFGGGIRWNDEDIKLLFTTVSRFF